jgi:hypothetical protein
MNRLHYLGQSVGLSPAAIDSFVDSTEDIVKEVAKGVFLAITEHAKEALPSLAIMGIQVSFPAIFFFLSDIEFIFCSTLLTPLPLILLFMHSTKDSNHLCYYAQALAISAVIAELALGILFPPSIGVHIAVQGIVLTASLIGNANSIKKGLVKVHLGLTNAGLKTSEKVANVVSGLISVGLGTVGTVATYRTGGRLYRGVRKYQTLDATQQRFALKYHAIENLGEAKTQKAVIIDGLNGEWAEKNSYYFDNQPDPVGMVIYKNYETRTYHVNSSAELTRVLGQAKKEMGGELDLVSFFANSDTSHMHLGPNYNFRATTVELNAISRNISSTGDILLWGSETARRDTYGRPSLSQSISKKLPNHLVTGIGETLFPDVSWAWFDGKRIQIRCWSSEKFYASAVGKFFNGLVA